MRTELKPLPNKVDFFDSVGELVIAAKDAAVFLKEVLEIHGFDSSNSFRNQRLWKIIAAVNRVEDHLEFYPKA